MSRHRAVARGKAIARATGKKPDTVSQRIRRGLLLWRRAFGSDPSSLLLS